jgi:ABC-type dipeptide/oligopeptide/nickel transport system permease component
VLGIRPAAYLYRRVRAELEDELDAVYFRTALAKGLPWRRAVNRHALRVAAADCLTAWLNSMRLMVGVLPLVEFFFGYPGLGRVLLLALGLSYGDQPSDVRPELVIGLLACMGVILVAIEAAVAMIRPRLDPRLSAAVVVA